MVRDARPSTAAREGRLRAGNLALTAVFAAALVVTLGLVALPSPALADDSGVSVSVAGGVYPLASTDIRMESETVQAICYRGFAEYRVDFRFVNDGEPQTLQLGFSSADIQPPEAANTEWAVRSPPGAPIALRAWQDGRPLKVTAGKGEDPMLYSSWVGYYLHTATFPHGETMITVSYVAGSASTYSTRFGSLIPPDLAALGLDTGFDGEYRYWLHTGAYWKGPIGRAIVRYRLADSFDGWGVDVKASASGEYVDPSLTTSPESYDKLDERTYQWVFNDLEPTPADDITLAFTVPELSRICSEMAMGGDQVALPASVGAVLGPDGTSERLGPNAEGLELPGWEAIDGIPSTAWGFSAAAYDKWLRVGVRGNQSLREIRILPGRNDTLTSFKEYARPKTLSIDLSDGTYKQITLEDEPTLQRFAISGTAKFVFIGVMDVYPGTKSDDIYISEIDLGNAPAPEFDTYANMMAGGAPPTTEPPASAPSSTTSSLSTTSSIPTTTNAGSSGPATTSPAAGTTGTMTNASAHPGTATDGDSGRLLWPAIAGAVVAVIALGGLICLVVRLRRQDKTPNGRGE
jgi:hypothetical protein